MKVQNIIDTAELSPFLPFFFLPLCVLWRKFANAMVFGRLVAEYLGANLLLAKEHVQANLSQRQSVFSSLAGRSLQRVTQRTLQEAVEHIAKRPWDQNRERRVMAKREEV